MYTIANIIWALFATYKQATIPGYKQKDMFFAISLNYLLFPLCFVYWVCKKAV